MLTGCVLIRVKWVSVMRKDVTRVLRGEVVVYVLRGGVQRGSEGGFRVDGGYVCLVYLRGVDCSVPPLCALVLVLALLCVYWLPLNRNPLRGIEENRDG